MSRRVYRKLPLSFDDQLRQLQNRNLIIQDWQHGVNHLARISYYRLSAYFIPYQSVKDQFDAGTTFQQILDTYLFDRELRLLVFDCIERIEVAIRTQFIYCMAMKYGNSHWQDDSSLFAQPYFNENGKKIDCYEQLQKTIRRAKNGRHPEVFIKHYINNYYSPTNPPSWMCFELLTIGELSYVFKGLRRNGDKKRIADFFDLHHTVFGSWLHALTYVRNICAHHSRLWNKQLGVKPERLKKPRGAWMSADYQDNSRIFYFLCLLKYLLLRVDPNVKLKDQVVKLFEKYPSVPIRYIGIPSDSNQKLLDWQNQPIWNKK